MTLTRDNNWAITLAGIDAAQTGLLGAALSDRLGAGDVLLLSGPIGAGKSHFARAVIRTLLARVDLVEDIPSPTFTLVQTYQAGKLEIWHSDLYRLSLLEEVEELGLLDAFQTALCLVEWPDRLGDTAPDGCLRLAFGLCSDPDIRDVTVSARGVKWGWVKSILGRFADE